MISGLRASRSALSRNVHGIAATYASLLLKGISPVVIPRAFSGSGSEDESKAKRGDTKDVIDQHQHSSFLRSIDLKNPMSKKKLAALIQAVVRTKANTGDFVPQIVIQSLCTTYRGMHIDEKKNFLLILAQDLHIDTTAALQSAMQFEQSFDKVKDSQGDAVSWTHENVERYLRSFRNLRSALSPLYETFFQQILSQRENGMLFLVHMRADLLQVLRKKAMHPELPPLRSLDASLKQFLASWFSVGFLKLKRVTYEHSSGQLLEKIIRYEAVHPVGTIVELKRRLGMVRIYRFG